MFEEGDIVTAKFWKSRRRASMKDWEEQFAALADEGVTGTVIKTDKAGLYPVVVDWGRPDLHEHATIFRHDGALEENRPASQVGIKKMPDPFSMKKFESL